MNALELLRKDCAIDEVVYSVPRQRCARRTRKREKKSSPSTTRIDKILSCALGATPRRADIGWAGVVGEVGDRGDGGRTAIVMKKRKVLPSPRAEMT